MSPAFAPAGVINHREAGGRKENQTALKSTRAAEASVRTRAGTRRKLEENKGFVDTCQRRSAIKCFPPTSRWSGPIWSAFRAPRSRPPRTQTPEYITSEPIKGRRAVLRHFCRDSNTQPLGSYGLISAWRPPAAPPPLGRRCQIHVSVSADLFPQIGSYLPFSCDTRHD